MDQYDLRARISTSKLEIELQNTAFKIKMHGIQDNENGPDTQTIDI